MLDGKLCASTTRYNDQTKGACGCGNSDPVPKDWWTKTSFTAALNAKNLGSSNPHLAWCPSLCGGCFRLCSTGGTAQGQSTAAGVCRVFKIENRCGDGFDFEPGRSERFDYWCSNEMTYEECQQNPVACAGNGNTNMFGYPAHFDLQDLNLQISHGLGWDNPEVTFERVPCSEWIGPAWDGYCQSVDAGVGVPVENHNRSRGSDVAHDQDTIEESEVSGQLVPPVYQGPRGCDGGICVLWVLPLCLIFAWLLLSTGICMYKRRSKHSVVHPGHVQEPPLPICCSHQVETAPV